MQNHKPNTNTTRRALLGMTGSAGVIALAGCIGGDDESDDSADGDDAAGDDSGADGEDEETLEIVEYQLIDRDEDADGPYVHDDHWDNGPLEVPGQELDYASVGAHIEDADGNEIELGDEYEMNAHVVEGAPETVDIDTHGDHIHVISQGESGPTELVFTLEHEGETVFESPELATLVGEGTDEFDDGAVDTVSILDRSPDPHEEVAEYHDDHWEDWSELPTVPVDDNISLGAEFVDAHGTELNFDESELELAVRVADDAADDVVWIDEEEHYHGDHVHIYGEGEGETEVVFMLWHDDHADWESEPLPVTVE